MKLKKGKADTPTKGTAMGNDTIKNLAAARANDYLDNHMDELHNMDAYKQLISAGLPASFVDTVCVCVQSVADVIKLEAAFEA